MATREKKVTVTKAQELADREAMRAEIESLSVSIELAIYYHKKHVGFLETKLAKLKLRYSSPASTSKETRS